ncbi:MAG: GNAT family N-acetyltransferase [Anaerolineales bacterium]
MRDFFKLRRLEKLCFDADAWPWIDILAALVFPETVRLVIEIGDELVGFVVGDRRRGQELGWIASIAVHPRHRRRGFATQLLRACERELDMPRVRLSLRRSNGGALRLYQQQGYVQIDHWPKYYRNGEDAIVMEKAMG